MLIRLKNSTADEYHHEDVVGVFGVITGATGAVLSSNVYDAFMAQQYVAVPSKQPAKCYITMSEPGIITGSGGSGVVVPSRGFQVMGSKPAPIKKHACKTAKKHHIPKGAIPCIKDILNGIVGGCITGTGVAIAPCVDCLVANLATCIFQPELCPAATMVCAAYCGSAEMGCIVGGILGGIAGIFGCMLDVLF